MTRRDLLKNALFIAFTRNLPVRSVNFANGWVYTVLAAGPQSSFTVEHA